LVFFDELLSVLRTCQCPPRSSSAPSPLVHIGHGFCNSYRMIVLVLFSSGFFFGFFFPFFNLLFNFSIFCPLPALPKEKSFFFSSFNHTLLEFPFFPLCLFFLFLFLFHVKVGAKVASRMLAARTFPNRELSTSAPMLLQTLDRFFGLYLTSVWRRICALPLVSVTFPLFFGTSFVWTNGPFSLRLPSLCRHSITAKAKIGTWRPAKVSFSAGSKVPSRRFLGFQLICNRDIIFYDFPMFGKVF